VYQKDTKQKRVMNQNDTKPYVSNDYTSYYINNYVIKNLSKGFSEKIISSLEKIKDEKNIEREIILNFVEEKNTEYFNAIQNKSKPFTYIKNGFENWFMSFEENEKASMDKNKARKENELVMRKVLYFDAFKKYKSWNYSDNEILENLINQGYDGFEFGTQFN
jgi:hypothetical protein